jgi:hypothetical protein
MYVTSDGKGQQQTRSSRAQFGGVICLQQCGEQNLVMQFARAETRC